MTLQILIAVVLSFFSTFLQSQNTYILNGTTTQNLGNGCYQLTSTAKYNSSSAWRINKINLNQPFTLNYTLNFGCSNNFGADGIAIVFQNSNDTTSAKGGSGGGLGYGIGPYGSPIKPSLAIEFDTWDNTSNGYDDIAADHIAITLNGQVTSASAAGPVPALTNAGNIEDCNDHKVFIVWNPDSMLMNIYFDCEKRLTYSSDIIKNIFSGDTLVYIGLTSATGVYTNNHSFCEQSNSSFTLPPYPDTSICKGDSIQLRLDTGLVVQWEFHPSLSCTDCTDPVANPISSTTYKFTASHPCGTVTDSFIVFVSDIQLSVSSDTSICKGDSVLLHASSNSNIEWWPNYHISNINDTTPWAYPQKPTEYFARAYDQFGCEQVDTVKMNLLNSAYILSPDTTMCSGNSGQLWVIGLSQIQWEPNKFLADTFSNPVSMYPPFNFTYFIHGIDSSNCSIIDTVQVSILDSLQPIASPDTSLCIGDELNLFASGGTYYQWVPHTFLSNDTIANPVVSPQVDITYSVIISNKCFIDTATVDIAAHQSPSVNAGPDLNIPANSRVTLRANQSNDVISYSWAPGHLLSCTTCPEPEATPDTTTLYTLTVKNQFGCSATDDVLVELYKDCDGIEMPNAFTPNNDGLNDRFAPAYDEASFDFNYMRIYNHWGELIYETNDLKNGWDGTLKGNPQPAGVYTYLLEISCDHPDFRKGNFTLIR